MQIDFIRNINGVDKFLFTKGGDMLYVDEYDMKDIAEYLFDEFPDLYEV